MAELKAGRSMDFNGLELECSQVKIADGTNVNTILKGTTAAALTNDTVGTTVEDGFLNIELADGTAAKIPYWLDNA